MSLFVDPRAGSKDLIAPLLKLGLPVEAAMLDYGDVAFVSKDRQPIGIEFKTLAECVTSLRDNRLVGHQLPGMLGEQGFYEVAWLLIEGEWKIDAEGELVTPKYRHGHAHWEPLPGRMMAEEFLKRMNTLIQVYGLNVWPSQNRGQTLAWIRAQYHWWKDGETAHGSGVAVYHRPMGIGFHAVSDSQRAVASYPGVGLKWGSAALKAFGSVEGCATASAAAWAELEHNGKRFGHTKAAKVRAFLQGQG